MYLYRLYNESCGLFAPIRIISAVFIKRSYLFSLVLLFNTLANGKGCFKVLFHTIFVNVYHHLLLCWYSAHVVRMLSTYGAEGKIHHDIRMTGDELWAKCCNTKNTQEVCRSLFSSNSFILCRLIRLHLFSHKAIKHRNAGKEKLFTHTIRYRTKKSHNSYTRAMGFPI